MSNGTARTYDEGETVQVTFKGRVYHCRGYALMIDLEQGSRVMVNVEHVTVDRLIPADGEPKPGDVWEDAEGNLFFAVDATGYSGGLLVDVKGNKFLARDVHVNGGPIRRVREALTTPAEAAELMPKLDEVEA